MVWLDRARPPHKSSGTLAEVIIQQTQVPATMEQSILDTNAGKQ
jgi:hypothetical protein